MEIQRIYFIGIGGIGMSALARYFLHEGREVAGYDRTQSALTEALAAALETEIYRYRAERLPAIIPIPGVSGNTGMGIKNVKKSVEQAVGSDIIFGNDN